MSIGLQSIEEGHLALSGRLSITEKERIATVIPANAGIQK